MLGQIKVYLKVKWRIFGITLGTTEWKPVIDLPIPLPVAIPRHALVNDRGVLLEVWTE